jgi:hypothetical protein
VLYHLHCNNGKPNRDAHTALKKSKKRVPLRSSRLKNTDNGRKKAPTPIVVGQSRAEPMKQDATASSPPPRNVGRSARRAGTPRSVSARTPSNIAVPVPPRGRSESIPPKKRPRLDPTQRGEASIQLTERSISRPPVRPAKSKERRKEPIVDTRVDSTPPTMDTFSPLSDVSSLSSVSPTPEVSPPSDVSLPTGLSPPSVINFPPESDSPFVMYHPPAMNHHAIGPSPIARPSMSAGYPAGINSPITADPLLDVSVSVVIDSQNSIHSTVVHPQPFVGPHTLHVSRTCDHAELMPHIPPHTQNLDLNALKLEGHYAASSTGKNDITMSDEKSPPIDLPVKPTKRLVPKVVLPDDRLPLPIKFRPLIHAQVRASMEFTGILSV